jgi:hypothetical protein
MPDVAAGALSIACGDFKRGYLSVDRRGGVLRDPTSAKPYVLLYTTKRVGGGVQDRGDQAAEDGGELRGAFSSILINRSRPLGRLFVWPHQRSEQLAWTCARTFICGISCSASCGLMRRAT